MLARRRQELNSRAVPSIESQFVLERQVELALWAASIARENFPSSEPLLGLSPIVHHPPDVFVWPDLSQG